MLQAFQNIIQQNQLGRKKFLLAVSGGVDSMALTDLFARSGLNCIVAHCNYHLRNEDSNADEQCVSDYCSHHNIPFFVQHFPIRKQADRPVNIQNEARILRYEWFEKLRQEQNCHLIVTAHHRDDTVETLLMNFFKGTGMAGLHGISMLKQYLFRPLIKFEKSAIYQYAASQKIPWREDLTNQQNDYTRNQIRNHLLPEIKKVFPHISNSLWGNIERFTEAGLLYEEAIGQYRKKLLQVRGSDIYIPIRRLKHCKPLSTILYELLRPYGFHSHQLRNALELLDAETGKYIQSVSHRLIRNRDFLIITSQKTTESGHLLIEREQLSFEGKHVVRTAHFTLEFSLAEAPENTGKFPDQDSAWLDLDALAFPVVLRPRKTADYFYPLGMPKKKKKISRFLTDRKLPLHEKEKIWILESQKRIAWVIGLRVDERFKIRPETQYLVKVRMRPLASE